MIVASVVLALSLAAAASLFLPNIYESKVVLQIFILQPRMPASAADYTALTLKNIGKDSGILSQLIEKLGLEQVSPQGLSKDLEIESLDVFSTISQRLYLPTVMLTVRSRSAGLARDLANAWAQILIEKVDNFYASALELYASVEKEAATAEADLLAKKDKLNDFQKTSDIILLNTKLQAKTKALLDYNAELDIFRLSVLKKDKSGYLSSPGTESELVKLVDSAEKEVAWLEEEIGKKELELKYLTFAFDTSSANYEDSLKKAMSLKLSVETGKEAVKIVSAATVNNKPIGPNKPLLILLAAFLGLVFSCAFILIRNSWLPPAGPK